MKYLILLLPILLASCATRYEEYNKVTGGYLSKDLGNGNYSVTVSANEFISADLAEKQMLVRAAEIAVQNDSCWMSIDKSRSYTKLQLMCEDCVDLPKRGENPKDFECLECSKNTNKTFIYRPYSYGVFTMHNRPKEGYICADKLILSVAKDPRFKFEKKTREKLGLQLSWIGHSKTCSFSCYSKETTPRTAPAK